LGVKFAFQVKRSSVPCFRASVIVMLHPSTGQAFCCAAVDLGEDVVEAFFASLPQELMSTAMLSAANENQDDLVRIARA
jgi:hypothetical protein